MVVHPSVQRARHLLASRAVRFARSWAPATLAIHGDAQAAAAAGSHEDDVAPPLGVSTTFASGGAHVYARASAPTRSRCEAVVGALEGGDAVLFSSGNAASHAVLSSLVARNAPRLTTVAIDGGYHGTHAALDALRAVGAVVDVAPLGAAASLRGGDVVWIETPRNPDLTITNVAAVAASTAATVVVDGTFAPPPAQRALDLGADLVLHSATKFLAGHSDALLGVLATRDGALADELRARRDASGAAPGSLEAWLLLRSLRTLEVRFSRSSETAAKIAESLEADPALNLRRVLYPHLPSHPDYAVARRQMALGGGVLAVECRSEAAAKALPAKLALFKDATSLGGVESLVEWRRKYDADVSPYLVRLSCGLEDPTDLLTDLQNTLRDLNDPMYDDPDDDPDS